MTCRDLTDLIRIYDSIRKLKAALGLAQIGFGYSDGIFGELSRIEDIIGRNTECSPDECVGILDGDESAEEKARSLRKRREESIC